ncbi:ribosomal protein S18-alanine N-acetyltransferase [Listeria costaricensis]|uniref:ribosomal protein S18-alanine N-acetyltransferase n=1 Tax=Listeria costaricensis TaxID=2026604 RepID=UPI000C0892C4|nr:ribosomal protein S18-alanine N-acetyltransferase [Listeria costaricensis]
MSFSFREAGLADASELATIERLVFSTPWTEAAFQSEFETNEYAHYLLLERDGEIVGYAGIWRVLDEGHITNIAVKPDYQGQHLGEALLRELLREASEQGVLRVTLEVRVSNTRAQNLYRKLNFQNGALRRRYYPDNAEDALVMWVDLS